MKKLITISVAVLALLAAFVSGVLVTTRQHNKLLKLYWFANLELGSQQATDAYFNEAPAVAVWALKHSIQQHEQAGQHGAHDILETDMPLFLSISHARIAKLYSQTGDQVGFRKHIEIALSHAKAKNSDTSQTDLLESIAKFDEIQKQSYKTMESQQSPGTYSSKAANGLTGNAQE